ncbi:MAG: proline dehydrogenase family protein [Cecembia sp.]
MKTFEEKLGAFDDLKVAYASRSDYELKKMYWLFRILNNNTIVHWGANLTDWAIQLGLPIKWLMKKTMFGHFCGGETITDCEKNVKNLAQFQVKSILDYSVEGKGTETSYNETLEEILKTIQISGVDANIPFAAIKITGLGDYNILTKIQDGKILDKEEQVAFEKIKERLDKLCKAAYTHGTKILIDAEDSWYQDTLDELVYEAMEKYNREKCVVFNTFQMYRHDMLARLKDAYQEAQEKGYYLGAKLVRGAYMEKERERANKLNYESPIQPDKISTDRDYDLALKFCVSHIDHLELFSGSHNENSNHYLSQLIELHGLNKNDERIYFAQLFGMSDNISFNLAKNGFNVVKYIPYGPVEKVIPYLIRRAEENTSVAGQSSRELQLIQKEIKRRKQD